jgi:DNA polymerase (family 10)
VIAEDLVDLLRPACLRLEIAGSIRRGRETIGDIDLLALVEPGTDLFGEPSPQVPDRLHERCDELLAEGTLKQRLDVNGRPAWGGKLKRATYRGLAVDIRACQDRSTWGAWLVISTGPAEFNKALVTERSQGGRLPPGFVWRGGFQLYRYGGRIETPTEESVLEALGVPFVAPEARR